MLPKKRGSELYVTSRMIWGVSGCGSVWVNPSSGLLPHNTHDADVPLPRSTYYVVDCVVFQTINLTGPSYWQSPVRSRSAARPPSGTRSMTTSTLTLRTLRSRIAAPVEGGIRAVLVPFVLIAILHRDRSRVPISKVPPWRASVRRTECERTAHPSPQCTPNVFRRWIVRACTPRPMSSHVV